MNIENLKETLQGLATTLKPRDEKLLKARLSSLKSAFPFNEYEYILMFLLDKHIMTFDEYEKLRGNYVEANKYLELYDLSPRIFGQIWGEQHLRDIEPRFKKPDRLLDPNFNGEYDLWIEGVRVEVKASRAVDKRVRGPILSKALRSTSGVPYWMNFQQIKVDTCDVFVFIGVWVDTIRYWVMSNNEVKAYPGLSHQHAGGIEYQIGITEQNFEQFTGYLTEPGYIGDAAISKGKLEGI